MRIAFSTLPTTSPRRFRRVRAKSMRSCRQACFEPRRVPRIGKAALPEGALPCRRRRARRWFLASGGAVPPRRQTMHPVRKERQQRFLQRAAFCRPLLCEKRRSLSRWRLPFRRRPIGRAGSMPKCSASREEGSCRRAAPSAIRRVPWHRRAFPPCSLQQGAWQQPRSLRESLPAPDAPVPAALPPSVRRRQAATAPLPLPPAWRALWRAPPAAVPLARGEAAAKPCGCPSPPSRCLASAGRPAARLRQKPESFRSARLRPAGAFDAVLAPFRCGPGGRPLVCQPVSAGRRIRLPKHPQRPVAGAAGAAHPRADLPARRFPPQSALPFPARSTGRSARPARRARWAKALPFQPRVRPFPPAGHARQARRPLSRRAACP